MAYDFASQQPRLGLNFNVENYGNIRCCLVALNLAFGTAASVWSVTDGVAGLRVHVACSI